MELYDKIIRIIDYNVIFSLVPMILILFLIEKVFKNKYPTQNALAIVKWIIISYTITTLTHFLVGISLYPDDYAFTNRATGPYKLYYWIMLFCSILLPFSLFLKKLATKFWYVALVAFGIKIGAYFELYVITVTSIHRDFLPDRFTTPIFTWIYNIGIVILQALIIVVIILAILRITVRRDSETSSE